MPRIACILLAVCLYAAALPVAAGADPIHLRLGLVKFGSAAWEIETIRRHSLDQPAGLVIDTVDLANPAATEVALQAGEVDAIVTDWLWVAHQRQAGQPLTFVPHNAQLGDILVPADSPVRTFGDLDGKRIGVAGGPLDKSWLLVRAYSRRIIGHDIADRTKPIFAAPPLLSQEIQAGRLDAVLTYWPFAARLSVQGFRTLISMADVMAGLGLSNPVPMLGYAISQQWIDQHPGALQAFLSAVGKADAIMAGSDEEWQHLRPLTAAENDAVLTALRQRFTSGVVPVWSPTSKNQAAKLYALLGETGGADLTDGNRSIPAGTFWNGTPQ